MTCAYCGQPEGGGLWIIDSDGRGWHADCAFNYRETLRRNLADRPIKERHDGSSTRDSGRRKPAG